ncbi:MAG TPA: hypothetical protein VFK11_03480 [Candidatus Saccharimonadales bacterium]|nr:hypothetical protein [Candidatus Saccharimonadales bacterium]
MLDPAIHEIIGREVDEIDDIRQRYESPNTDLGDRLSDDYFRVYDLTTKPGELTENEERMLARSVGRLNQHKNLTRNLLKRTVLLDVYNDVIGQLNELNASKPSGFQLEPVYRGP